MISHFQVLDALSAFIAADSDVLAYSLKNFGTGVKVIEEAFGDNGFPGEKDAPFVFLFRDGENSQGNSESKTFTVKLICGVSSQTDGAVDSTEIAARSATQNGLVRNGILAKAEGLRDLIWKKVYTADCFLMTINAGRNSECSILDYPLEWAELAIDFQTPSALDGEKGD